MKKIYLLLTISIFLVGNLSAQDYINESFDSDIPSTWSISSESDIHPWFWSDSYGGNSIDGTGFAFVDSDDAGSGAVDLIENLDTPEFDASAGNIILVNFDHFFNELGEDEVSVEVWNGSEWNTAWSYDGPDDMGSWANPENTTVIITDYVSTATDTKVRFRYIDGGSWAWYWAIDNVVIKSVDCIDPLNLQVSQIGEVSAVVEWVSGSGTSNLAYGPSGFDITDIAGTGGTLVSGASSPYLIPSLTGLTEYDFYVQDDCGVDGISDWSGPVSFTTIEGCLQPTFNQFSGFSNPGSSSIDLTFGQGIGDVYIIYGPEGFLFGSAGDTAGVATSPYTLGGLDALTFYDIYFYLDCSGDALGNSDPLGPFTFNTLVDGPGTDCANPIVLNGNLPYNQTGQSICGYGNNVTSSACNIYAGYEEIVFIYSPETDSVNLGIYAANSTTESQISFEITDMCPDSGDASCVASGSLPWNGDNYLLSTVLENGEIYYITITGYTGVGCTFDLSIFEIDCIAPTELSASSGSTTSLSWTSTSGASLFQVEWGPEGFAPGSGTIVDGEYGVDGPPIDITGLSDTTNYAFYVTDVCGIGSQSIATGPFIFSGPPPSNDQCADAIQIECGDSFTGNTSAATSTGNETDFCGTSVDGPGIWYSFIGTGDDVELSLCGSDYDTKIHLYSGDCTSLVCEGGNDDSFAQCGNTNSYLYASTVENETYYVFISGYAGNTGIFNLEYNCITCPLISGINASSTNVSASINWTTTNIGAEFSVEYGPIGFNPGSGTSITGIVGTDGPPVDIPGLTAGSSYDVYVYEICAPGDFTSSINTSFTTNLLPPPANDLCSGAYDLSCGGIDSGSTEDATQIGNPIGPLCGFASLNSNAVWYQVTGNGQLATISTCGSDFDTELFVFTGSCDSLECFVMADGNPGSCEWGSSEVNFLAEDGVTYYVAVAGWSDFYSGNYVINYECNPCGDPSNISISLTDVSATIAWDTYLPGADFTLVYDISGIDLFPPTNIITGINGVDTPVEITGLMAGTTYDVCLYEYCDAELMNTDTLCFSFTTNLLPPPANDDVCNAIELNAGDTLLTSNIYASTQNGEPIPPATGCGNQTGWCNSNLTSTTWYTYTPDVSGLVTISTCHPQSYDTQLAIYTTEDCLDFDSFTLIAANDDAIGGCSAATFASTVQMCVSGGATYYIQVDPYSTQGQEFSISVDFVESALENVVAYTTPGLVTFDFDYFGLNDAEFSILITNTESNEIDSIFGNTADLPVLYSGVLSNVLYEYIVYIEDGCGTSSDLQTFVYVSGINELEFGQNVSVYPNPALSNITLIIEHEVEKGTSIRLINIQGKEMYSNVINEDIPEYKNDIDVSNYARGVYILKIENENSSIQERIIVQ